MYDITGGLSKTDLMNMCPALLQQTVSGVCDDKHDEEEDEDMTDAESESNNDFKNECYHQCCYALVFTGSS